MLTLFDNLTAAIVGVFLMLMLVTQASRSAQSNVEAMRFYSARTQSMALIETIKADFANIGAGVPAGDVMIEELVDADDMTIQFGFYGDIDTTRAGVERVRYRVSPSGTACSGMQSLDGAPGPQITCYHLRREERIAGSWKEAGGSPASLTEFKVTLFDANGLATANPAQAAEVGVALVMLSPLGQEREVRKLRWEARFRPMNLSR